jgi:predicted DNA-binding transcriptional regulator AlpA
MTTVEIDQVLQLVHAATIPAEHRWVDASGVGAMLGGKSGRTVLERYACRPDFPKAMRDGMNPIWNVAEVSEWVKRQRDKAA